MEVLDSMRTDLALHYLHRATLSVSQVAWLLGFQEVGAFTNAFKRWAGLSPSRFRSAGEPEGGTGLPLAGATRHRVGYEGCLRGVRRSGSGRPRRTQSRFFRPRMSRRSETGPIGTPP